VTAAHDKYLSQAPTANRRSLEQLQEAVVSVVPDADQVMRREAPAFQYTLIRHSRLSSIQATIPCGEEQWPTLPRDEMSKPSLTSTSS
jgi:hypothetical protein